MTYSFSRNSFGGKRRKKLVSSRGSEAEVPKLKKALDLELFSENLRTLFRPRPAFVCPSELWNLAILDTELPTIILKTSVTSGF
jgi:hypothetical protein